MKLDVAEPLSSTRDGQFVLGSPVGVVERRPRGTPFGNASQVLDGQRGAQAALGGVELRPVELEQGARSRTLGTRRLTAIRLSNQFDMKSASDPFDLKRFVYAQAPVYRSVVEELRAGRKRGHWMWFVFPQLRGLGSSPLAVRYGISSLEEAQAYLQHDLLGPRLHECTGLVNQVQGRSIEEIFGPPDDLKLCSSMTLFARATDANQDFVALLAKYYGGGEDRRTVALLAVT